MKNLTTLLQFIQEEHEQIHSVSFEHFILNQVRCNIVFKGRLDDAIIGIVNIFISQFNAKLSSDFGNNNISIYVIAELNK